MKLFSLLLKIWIAPFYRSNTGFFLFFFFLFFGTVSPGSLISYHLSLIQSILSSSITSGGVLILWLCYNYKCTQFIFTSINKEEGRFLFQLQALPFRKQFLLLSLIELLLFFPILSYITTVAFIAIQKDQFLQAILLILYGIAVCLGSSYYYCTQINKTWRYRKPLLAFRPLPSKPKRLLFLLLHFSLKQKTKQLLAVKLLSIIIIYIALVWNGDRYDHDSLVLFLLIIILTHATLAFQFVQFMERSLLFIRNLSIPTIRIFLIYYTAFSLLFFPELVYLFLVGHSLIAAQHLLAIFFSLVHTLLLFTTVQYSGGIDRSEFVKIIFGVSFVSIFFFNSEQYALWAIITSVIATLLFFTSYGQYELPPEA
jgi:hypothetical protein